MADIELLRKRLYFQSAHRGTKENDLMLTKFVERHLPDMDEANMRLYDRLLQEPDGYIYDWLAKQHDDYPAEYSPLISQIRRINNLG